MKHPHHTMGNRNLRSSCALYQLHVSLVPRLFSLRLLLMSHAPSSSHISIPQTTTINQPYCLNGEMEAAAKCPRHGWRWCRCCRERRCHLKLRAQRCFGERCMYSGHSQTIMSLVCTGVARRMSTSKRSLGLGVSHVKYWSCRRCDWSQRRRDWRLELSAVQLEL
jgi:hypothetical protein